MAQQGHLESGLAGRRARLTEAARLGYPNEQIEVGVLYYFRSGGGDLPWMLEQRLARCRPWLGVNGGQCPG